jgi:hypothetical protein
MTGVETVGLKRERLVVWPDAAIGIGPEVLVAAFDVVLVSG